MVLAVNCDLQLADDTGFTFQHKAITIIEHQPNKNFSNICDWLVDIKLSIHFGEDKTKSILFAPLIKCKKLRKLNITYGSLKIKQYSKVTYLGCMLNESLPGESMALNVVSKINTHLKFLCLKNKFLSRQLRQLQCNALIQPHFDYACPVWYPNLNKKFKTKLKTLQNKCVRVCLQLHNRAHVGITEFKKLNWLPVDYRFRQFLAANMFKFFDDKCALYIKDVFDKSCISQASTRNSTETKSTTKENQYISFLAPSIWNNLLNELKRCTNLNTFKHKIKEYFFYKIRQKDNNIYLYD